MAIRRTRVDGPMGRGFDRVEVTSGPGGARRLEHDESFGSGRGGGVDHPDLFAQSLGREHRGLMRAAHAGGDREHDHTLSSVIEQGSRSLGRSRPATDPTS